MSRVAKMPVAIPSGVNVAISDASINVKGPKGTLQHALHPSVNVAQEGAVLTFSPATAEQSADAIAGATRAVVNNMVVGVSKGYERRLTLVGVGYRAQVQGKALNLTLGFSHPVNYPIPEGITIETPSQTEIVVKGADKQRVGQVAAEIRAYREPEPYKGKGVRYANEQVTLKEAKKK